MKKKNHRKTSYRSRGFGALKRTTQSLQRCKHTNETFTKSHRESNYKLKLDNHTSLLYFSNINVIIWLFTGELKKYCRCIIAVNYGEFGLQRLKIFQYDAPSTIDGIELCFVSESQLVMETWVRNHRSRPWKSIRILIEMGKLNLNDPNLGTKRIFQQIHF